MKTLRASFTVEAAVLVPMFLMIVAASVGVAADLYEEVAAIAEEPAPSSTLDSVKIFRLTEMGEKLFFGE